MKKILIAPNSFKECSTSVYISNLFEQYLGQNPELELITIPVSDGGDGFLDVCKYNFMLYNLSFEIKRVYSDDLFNVDVCSTIDNKTLYIESAKVLGLQDIPLNKRNPLILNSSNLGELLRMISERVVGVEKVIIGIGGTGTNDLGLGVCSAFGLKVYDSFEVELDIFPQNYKKIKKIEWSKPNLTFDIYLVADVDNPLLGESGATETFAGQKGANKDEIDILESGFTNVFNILNNNSLTNLPQKLSGAGGGLAAGFQIFFDAKIIEAKQFINENLFKEHSNITPDFVVTGEGFFDNQTLNNKGAKVIIDRFAGTGCPVFLVCGKIDHNYISELGTKVIPIELVKFFENEKESIRNVEKGLKLASDEILQYLAN